MSDSSSTNYAAPMLRPGGVRHWPPLAATFALQAGVLASLVAFDGGAMGLSAALAIALAAAVAGATLTVRCLSGQTSSPAALVPVVFVCLACGWYFVPSLQMVLDPSYRSPIHFDDRYLGLSTLGLSLGYLSVCAGMILHAGRHWPTAHAPAPAAARVTRSADAYAQTVERYWDWVPAVGLAATAAGCAFTIRPLLEVASYNDLFTKLESGNGWGRFLYLLFVWGVLFCMAYRDMLLGRRRWVPLLGLLNAPALYLLLVQVGRRQDVFMLAVMVVVTHLTARPIRPRLSRIALGGGVLVLVAAVAFAAISITREKDARLDASTLAFRPFEELHHTASMHARHLYYWEDQDHLWGRSYLYVPLYALPVPYEWLPLESRDDAWAQRAVVATIPWAAKTSFGMGSSVVAEAFVNFGHWYAVALVPIGFAYAAMLTWCGSPPRSSFGLAMRLFLVGGLFFTVRQDAAQVGIQFRPAVLFVAAHAAIHVLARVREGRAAEAGGAVSLRPA